MNNIIKLTSRFIDISIMILFIYISMFGSFSIKFIIFSYILFGFILGANHFMMYILYKNLR